MNADSQPERLPLAEAIVAWSDPALITEIRRIEATISPGMLERLERPTLESLKTQRRPPVRWRPLTLNNHGVEALDRAWERVFGVFRRMVEDRAVLLEGVADWIKSRVSFHQVPTQSTIAKVLGSEYAVLKTRSNAAMTRSKN